MLVNILFCFLSGSLFAHLLLQYFLYPSFENLVGEPHTGHFGGEVNPSYLTKPFLSKIDYHQNPLSGVYIGQDYVFLCIFLCYIRLDIFS